ncbi:MAG: sugar transferase [Nitrospiraceae bacterium]
MKAVIIENAPWNGSVLTFPVGKELLIEHLLLSLKKHDIRNVAIISHERNLHVREFICRAARAYDMNLLWKTYTVYRGTAGSLQAIEQFLDVPCFLGIDANVYMRDLDLHKVLGSHQGQRSAMTFVAQRHRKAGEDLENIEVDEEGQVSRVSILHASKNRRAGLKPCGIYLFNRDILSHVPRDEYFDVKEQLVPLLRHKGVSVRAHVIEDGVRTIDGPEDFLGLNREILLANGQNPGRDKGWLTRSDEIIIGENSEISPRAFLLGPLVIGPNCIVEDFVQIIGPTVIGPASHLEKGCMVRESVLPSGAKVEPNARIEYCVVLGNGTVPEGVRISSAVWSDAKPDWELYKGTQAHRIDKLERTGLPRLLGATKTWRTVEPPIYRIVKRFLDIIGVTAGMVLCGPLLLLIAIAIKADSPGPVLFSQRRCGKAGREFWMHKFRTMVVDAEQRQKELRANNSVDGPMFKLQEDPRITRVGRILRKTSLDELPQLINVLRGEMSLVGPRPLAYEEMKFCPTWRDVRLRVKPGITGLWQVKSRDRNRFSEWIRYDIEYVKSRSVLVDLRILMKTAGVLWKGV